MTLLVSPPIRWCFTHHERTVHLLTCIGFGFDRRPCNVVGDAVVHGEDCEEPHMKLVMT